MKQVKYIKAIAVVYLLIAVPFFIFFCYHLGKTNTFKEAFEETLFIYLPLLPLLLAASYLSVRAIKIK